MKRSVKILLAVMCLLFSELGLGSGALFGDDNPGGLISVADLIKPGDSGLRPAIVTRHTGRSGGGRRQGRRGRHGRRARGSKRGHRGKRLRRGKRSRRHSRKHRRRHSRRRTRRSRRY